MRNLINPVVLALSLAVSSVAFAQTTEAPATEAPATEEGSGPGVPGLSMGVEDAGVSQPFVKSTHGDWQLRCVRAAGDAEICQLYQLLRDADGNSVAEFNLFPLPDSGQAVAGANIVTPLETLLTANLRLAVDGGQNKVYPYSFCSQVGCFARIGLTAPEVDSFRKGASARVTIVPAAAPDDTVVLTLSLSGFTAGFNALLDSEKARTASE